MSSHVLSVDLGTTGVKVCVVSPDGRVVAGASETLPLLMTADGGVEQDPHLWWQAIGRCARHVVSTSDVDARDVGTIAVTSQFMSVVPVDAVGRPLANCIMWMDERGRHHWSPDRSIAAATHWLEVHGLVPFGNDSVGQMHTALQIDPSLATRAAAFVQPMDAIVARLTGNVTATQHTAFPLFAVDNRMPDALEYSADLLERTGIPPSLLPTLVPRGHARGAITRDAADHLGVTTDAIVADACIDTVATAFGTGAVTTARCGVSLGTTTVVATHTSHAVHDARHGLASGPGAYAGSWFVMAENGVGAKALQVFTEQMVFADDGLGRAFDERSIEQVIALASTSPVGANGVMFAPWLAGSMAPRPRPSMRGGFTGISLGTTRADMARAVLEGVALNLAWLLPHVGELTATRHPEITLGGGGARSPLWTQIVADACGVTVRRVADSGFTTATGAALLAMFELGEFALSELPDLVPIASVHEPDARHSALLDGRLRSMIDFHERTTEFYRSFDQLEAP